MYAYICIHTYMLMSMRASTSATWAASTSATWAAPPREGRRKGRENIGFVS